jgi:hypothetical protein
MKNSVVRTYSVYRINQVTQISKLIPPIMETPIFTVGDYLLVQEPQNHFSHDCLKVSDIKADFVKFEICNGDETDGKFVYYSTDELYRCKVTNLGNVLHF